jgi:predicted CoA-binding protein
MVIGKDAIPAATEDIPAILKSYHTIAVVGLSPEPDRASHQVAAYLQAHGYRIIPVNPQCREVLGETCYASLKEIPEPVEVVDIFRKAEAIPALVEEAMAVGARVIWMQLGLESAEAAAKARAAGLQVVMNRCMKIEHAKL